MTQFDRLWISSTAFAVVMVVQMQSRAPELAEFIEIIWAGSLVLLLIRLTFRKRGDKTSDAPDKTMLPKVPAGPAQGATPAPDPSPGDVVRAQLEAYQVAGFSEAEARNLVQEALRTQLKQQGGWQP